MKTEVKVLGYEFCCNPIDKGTVNIRLKNGKTQNMDLLTLYQSKELFYQLPKAQIDLLTVWATIIGQNQEHQRTQTLIDAALKGSTP